MDEQNQNQSPVPEIKPAPGFTKTKKEIIIAVAVILLFVAAGALGYWQINKSIKQGSGNVLYTQPTSTPTEPESSPTPSDFTNPTPTGASAGFTCKDSGSIMRSKSGMMDWTPVTNLNVKIFKTAADSNAYIDDSSVVVGHFLNGDYKGGDLIVTTLLPQFDEPGGDIPRYYEMVKLQNSYILLSKYSDTLPDPQEIKTAVNLSVDDNFTLADLEFPGTLESTNPSAKFKLVTSLGYFTASWQEFCADNLLKVFTDSQLGDVYTDKPDTDKTRFKHGFYVKSPDGSTVTYELLIPFLDKTDVPAITWNSGTQNRDEYTYQAVGGCGASQFLDAIDIKSSDLKSIGKTFNGQTIYGYKDSDTADLKNMYEDTYLPEGQTKPSYEVFVASNPIFFWQNQFGQFVRFKAKKYQPMAECGKPVIYLYPQTTQKISVSLNPVGGFTYTEPAYNSGWNVVADPQSNIKNLGDGKTYPYLFWEGRGGMYQTPDRGFVVEQSNIHQFLLDKLHKLGLNDKETNDFMEFWEPKMQNSPYYFVTFMGNQAMDEIAPLSVSPKPDTVIRILMDFKPLTSPINVQGFNIRTPERKGFTVVEWGGVLR